MTVATEGIVDSAVAARILSSLRLELGPVHGQRGKGWSDRQLVGFNQAARFAPWLVLRDLNHDGECAPAITRSLLATPAPHMRFRIAVRSVEAWLLGDAERISAFLRVSSDRIPALPDELADPKATLVNLARQSSSREVRDDLVPARGTSARVGPAYPARLIEFTNRKWRPSVASRRSGSLRRCLASLHGWARPEPFQTFQPK